MPQGFAFQTQSPVSVFLAPWARDYALPWKLEIMPERRNHLLVIGIDQYQDKTWPSLNAVASCDNLCDVLMSRYEGFYPENCIKLYNKEATLNNIVSALNRLAQELDPHDNLIIVYAGHTNIDPKSGAQYWVAYDAPLSEIPPFFTSGVLQEFLSKTLAFHVLLLMDAVLSGNGTNQDVLSGKTDPVSFNPDPADQPSRWALLPGQAAQPDPTSLLASLNRLLQDNQKDYLNLFQVARNAEQGPQLFQLERREQTEIGQFGFYLKHNAQQVHTEEVAQQNVPKIFYVRFSVEMMQDEANTASIQREIQVAWQRNPPKYMAWSTEGQQPDFEIYWFEGKYDKELILTKPGSRTPLFISQRFPALFVEVLDKFSRFENLLRLPEAPAALRKQFEVQVEVMEGEAYNSDNFSRVFDAKTLPPDHYRKLINPETVELKYLPVNEDMQPPAIKVNISFKGGLPRDYWVGALYGDTQLGVNAQMLPVQNIGSLEGVVVKMEYTEGRQKWDAIPIHIDSALKAGGATIFKDYIILFVAEQNFDLTMYEQSPVELEITKSMDFSPKVFGDSGNISWHTIKIPILIHYPQLPVHSSSREGNVFPGFKLRNAYNRSARVLATDLRSAKRRVQLLTESGIPHNPGVFLPPDELWKGLRPSEDTFVPTPLAASDGCISILEFTQIDGDWSEEFPMEIIPDVRLARDETILPFAYDESSGLYYPVGYTNENGVVLVTKMPAPTSGMIGLEGLSETRAQNSSVKLFFRKFRWNRLSGSPRPATLTLLQKNTLAITRREYKGNPEEEEIRTEIQRTLASRPNVILLVSGFIGDFMDMALAVFDGGRENTVLVFTYDTLSTPMDAAARALQNLLNNCLSPQHFIMTVAHSTGGLLARRWVEFEGGNTRCQSLLLVGTPHGGISQALLQKRLFRLFAAAMNRWEISNEDKNLLLFAGRILNNPNYKLGIELNLHGEFIQTLRYSTPKGINYWLFIGDEAILDKQEAEMDPSPILKRLNLYDTEDGHRNDLVFDVESMKPFSNNKSTIVKSHHLGYFYHQEVLNLLSEMTKPV